METLSTRGDDKAGHGTKLNKEPAPWEKEFACNHVIINVKQDISKKETKGKLDVVSFCVMCGEKVKDVDEGKRSKKKDKKKSRAKQESARMETEKLMLRRNSSSLSEVSEESLESPSLTRRKENKFSLFGSRRSTSSLSQAVVTSELVEACSMHGHKKLKYYCENHQEICCSVCVNCLHPKCDRVMYIRDEIDTNWETEKVDTTLEALRNIRTSFEDIIGVNEKTKLSLETQKRDAREQRDELKKKLIKLFDDFERKSEKQIEKFITLETQHLNSVIDVCNDAIVNINKSIEIMEYSMDTHNSHEIFVATHKAIGQKPNLAVALSESIKNTKDMHIDFISESNIDNLDTIQSVGEMHFSAEEIQFPEMLMKSVSKIQKPDIRSPRTITNIFAQSFTTKSMSPRQPADVLKYSVTLSDDKKTCANVGISLTPDGKVALIDFNNWKVKVFDSKFRQGSSLKLTSGPRGLVSVGPQELAVSLPDESKIQIVTVAKKLKALRTILTEIPCYGIASHNQELVLLCDDGFSTAAVQFIDMEGKLVRKIEMKKSSSRTVLKNPWSITLNPDGQKMCITDRGRLVCMDTSGQVIFVYKHEHLENARGVTIDHTGKFYVCGSNNVHQVSPDGSRSKIILKEDDIVSPEAICYDSERRSLLVTNTGSDVVSVFKLKKFE